MPCKTHKIDGVNVYEIPKRHYFAKQWLKKQNYDVYLSIEITFDLPLKLLDSDTHKKLVFWIQDPRPKSDWDEIKTVKLFPEPSYYDQEKYDLIHNLYKQNRVKFISQAHCLNNKAKELYNLDTDVDIQYLPNPIEIEDSFDVTSYKKKNMVIFLGRIESIKRGWLFCEIAKKCPEYEFYMLGQTFRDAERNSEIMTKYQNIPNLHFAGHVDGEQKNQFLKDAKILVNTSIHEALPISFLEALSYGTLLVSNQNPDNLTSKFGVHIGQVLGDGFEDVHLYIDAIRSLINNEKKNIELSQNAIKYIKKIHSVPQFITDMGTVLIETTKNL
ncbi:MULTISPECIES: glycosyltransferase family 4 protein [Pasteurellaceae]|uniref:Glycosyltransferase family 4 protein n=1 Tax=Pasteurella atlantica TaxID=2827233 RepID=A0AAW8CNJ6_9PAST|nr:glycosyltransferase family 4 protein [Pasteurella atlantica]MDP8039889.1 glycosyltransferase family 4 protein [Pasteurella atlantica]MDP8041951.1 glycosyltransferase family 4 protein [Pasteurella atlantica]MDP8044100.1 glycosyltransferase family 4 protein [Pasteurella atlantica]MDP8046150.1 glycosyltransferase family 4 protein [Pasteurella atlantica]MDP8062078.1 glycosyltransferase family 4 protein [Pasteurella atlantica]